MLLTYSVGLFFIDTWVGMAIASFILAVAVFLSKIPLSKIFATVIPVYVIVGFTVLGNMFAFIDGSLVFTATGLIRGLFFALRILLLVWASLVFCYSTLTNEITDAFSWFMAPLRVVKVPVDDIAMMFSIAIRFIPLIVDEFFEVKDAQYSRGANFSQGSIFKRLKAYCSILMPILIGLFRRAETLASAMDVRCYGLLDVRRTSISARKAKASQVAGCLVFCIAFILLAVSL